MDDLDDILKQVLEMPNATELVARPILEAVKRNLIDSGKYPDTHDTIVKILESSVVKKYIHYLVGAQMEGNQISEYDFQSLKTLIYILQTIYNYAPNGASPVSDHTYDRLYELLESHNEEMITTPLVSRERIAYHTYKSLRGTLKKVYSLAGDRPYDKRRTLDDWIAECERKYKEYTGVERKLGSEDVYIFPKWDGVSVVFEFAKDNSLIRALTRGNTDTNEAQDVTPIFSHIYGSICEPEMLGKAYGVKTEVMVPQKDKDAYNRKYGTDYHSTRTIASSIINSCSRDGREKLLEIVGLRTSTIDENGEETLQELSADVYRRPNLRCRLCDRDAIQKFSEKHRQIKGLNTDGVVIYFADEEIRKVLGRKDNKNQYEVAYKYSEEVAYTTLEDIDFGVTTFGRIFPTAILKPVTMKGNKITSVSLGSIALMRSMGLRKGDTVRIHYEICPELYMDDKDIRCARSDNPVIECPTKCPECGNDVELNLKGTILTCINPECPARVRGRILNYVNKVGIQNIGESTIKTLMDNGLVKVIPDLYDLRKNETLICTLPRFDKLSTKNILDDIDAHRDIKAPVLIGAIGIESVGKKTAAKILQEYTIEDLMEFAEAGKVSALVSIPDIGDIMAKRILDGLWENALLLKKLLKQVRPIYPEKKAPKFVVVFHNIRSRKLTMDIELLGGVVEDSLTKRTTFLIVPDDDINEASALMDKARRYAVTIVGIGQVADLLQKIREDR